MRWPSPHPRRAGARARARCRGRHARRVAPVVLLTVAGAVAADNAPRLFTTPAERDRLDQLRAAATAEDLARQREQEQRRQEPARAAAAPAPEPPKRPRVHVRGFVRRSDGPSAVWVNDASTLGGERVGDGVAAGRIEGSSVVVTLPDGRRVRLRPGQTWDPERERVVDVTDR